jgi:hypothetical protein
MLCAVKDDLKKSRDTMDAGIIGMSAVLLLSVGDAFGLYGKITNFKKGLFLAGASDL